MTRSDYLGPIAPRRIGVALYSDRVSAGAVSGECMVTEGSMVAADIASAAVHLVASCGVRGLQAEAVDALAGVPEGTTRSAFPNDEELLAAVIDRLVQVDGQIWTDLGGVTPTSTADFADRVAGWVQRAIESEPVASRTRVELFLAAPERASSGHHAIIDVMGVILDVLGVSEPGSRAKSVVDFVSGTVMHHLSVRSDEPIDRAGVQRAVHALVTGR